MLCPAHHPNGCAGGKHGTDVYGHVEDAESRITAVFILRVVVEIAYHYLQVALEQACSEAYQHQCREHGNQRHGVGAKRKGHEQVADEHDHDAQCDHAPETKLIGKYAAKHRQEINQGEETAIDVARCGCREAEISLQEQDEDGKHRVISESLACVGQCQRVKTFGLIFKHCYLILEFLVRITSNKYVSFIIMLPLLLRPK